MTPPRTPAPEPSAAVRRAVKRHVWNEPRTFRAATALGLEPWLEEEIRTIVGDELGAVRTVPGATTFDAPFDVAFALLLRLSVADALHLRLAEVPADAFPMLRGRLDRVRFDLWLPAAPRLRVEVRSRRSRLRDEEGLRRTVVQAVRAAGVAATPPTGDGPEGRDATLRVTLDRDRAEVWLDAAGAPLHRRGDADRPVVPGSLRETTAAALARFGTPPDADRVIDPFCGSGTVLEEVAAHLDDRPVGARRRFALERSPVWREGRMRHERRRADGDRRMHAARFVGIDRDRSATDAARAALEASGADPDRFAWIVGDARDPEVARAAVGHAVRPALVTNPPYGRRVGRDADEADALLAAVLPRFPGASVALLYPRPDAVADLPGIVVEEVVRVRMRGLANAMIRGRIA